MVMCAKEAAIKLSPLARKVYAAVLTIPLGEVRSYQWLARRVGRPGAARAVAQILKRNPFLFLVPCHRIVNKNGGTGGYVLGARAKRELLELEKNIKECLASRE